MNLVFYFVVFCCLLLAVCATTSTRTTNWNDFRVSWPKFTTLPQSQKEAQAQGWLQDTWKTCTGGSAQGFRFYLPKDDNPLSLFLLFNTQGRISGIQGASQTMPPALISPDGPWNKDIVLNTTVFTLTMYFRDPSTLCSGGDSGSKIGDGLWFVIDGDNSTVIPQAEKDLPIGTGTWGKGKCFLTMGNHYWNNVDYNSTCDTLLPLFLLYNQGQLNGFGWALSWGASQPGERWEHPTSNVLPLFFAPNQIAKCFSDPGRIFSTMHFYFSNPVFDFC